MKLTMKDVKDGKAMLMNYSDISNSQTAEYINDSDRIPRIKFSWLSAEYINLTSEEAQEVVTLGFEVRKDTDGTYYTSVVKASNGKPVVNYVNFCNFRRYSWSETFEEDGKYGYAGGVVYANCWDGGLTCSTPEQVVRETLIAAIHISKVPDRMKFDIGVRVLWQKLLDDALKNISDHASTPVSTKGTGYIKSVRVIE